MDRTKDAQDVFDKNAAKYAELFMDLTHFHAAFDSFCIHLSKVDASVFEMACGPGNITRYMLSQRPEIKMLCSDIAPQMLALAKNHNPSARFCELDCREIKSLNQKFDGIISGFVLPYLTQVEVERMLKDSFDLLNDKGVMYLSTMVDEENRSTYVKPSSGKGSALFTHYYNAPYLKTMLLDIGFEMLDSGFILSTQYKDNGVKDWWIVVRKA